jgi:hypothetical protein
MKINSITIDSSNSITELCTLGVKYPTDKSPYNTDDNLHKHAYTAIYNLLFSNLKYASFSDLKFSLETILKRKVDLLEEKAVKNPYFKQSLNQNKVLIYG